MTDEWWLLSKYEVSEMTKRGVPGVWTYGFYDGWVPNYMFFIGNSHNAIGRFYETQSYGPMKQEITLGAQQTSREWFRGNPPLAKIQWGPRNNVNLQQSGVLLALSYIAKNKDTFLENYWLKNKRAVEKGKNEAPHAWVIPAGQRRKVEAAELVNLFRRQGVEVHTANAAFTAGKVEVAAGDYILRMDQPYRTLVDMLMDVQFYAPANPRPYDDTGWTFPLLRNVKAVEGERQGRPHAGMTLLAADAKVPGLDRGQRRHADHRSHDGQHARHVPLQAQGREDARGRRAVRSGRPQVHGGRVHRARRRSREARTVDQGARSLRRRRRRPRLRSRRHDLDIPRIGYVHAWQRTQDEGWVRLAFDTFGVPYTYFADQKLKEGNLRAKYDVIVYPHVGGSPQSHVNGLPMTGAPLPYKKTAETPNLGVQDESDDIRGGMGLEGLANLAKFVQEGGTLITEGSTAALFPSYGMVGGVTVEEPANLFVRGSILKAMLSDKKSPITYGYEGDTLPVYFNQAPVLATGGIPGGIRRRWRWRRGAVEHSGRRDEHHAERGAADAGVDGAAGSEAAGAAAGGRSGGVPSAGAERGHQSGRDASARRAALPGESQRHAAERIARRRTGAVRPRGRRGCADGEGPRGDVRDPSLLALADAGAVFPRLQLDPELERSRRRQGDQRREDDRAAVVPPPSRYGSLWAGACEPPAQNTPFAFQYIDRSTAIATPFVTSIFAPNDSILQLRHRARRQS